MPELIQDLSATLEKWYKGIARPFFAEFSELRVPQLDADFERLERLRQDQHPELPVCFLGQSGVGKSTLINALVDQHIGLLPQGGVGPLTAQATQVRYSSDHYFRVSYLGPRNLNQVVFALKRHQERASQPRGETQFGSPPELEGLTADDRHELELSLPPEAPGEDPTLKPARQADVIKGYIQQAKLLVRGEQFAEIEIPYLIRALEFASRSEGEPPTDLDADDVHRAQQIRAALDIARSKENIREYRYSHGKKIFLEALQTHAAGHLAPLIRTLDVGWSSPILSSGLVLVDLPGVGVVNDEYRKVTAEFIRRAKAVVLVVDRSGVTEASADLLRTVGFLTSLLHEGPELPSQFPRLLVAVVKLDLTATDARTDERETGESPRPWLAHFEEACAKAVNLVRWQLRDELSKLVEEGPSSTMDDRVRVMHNVLAGLLVFPVSALEYRKYYVADEEEQARIKAPEQSRIPELSAALKRLAEELIDAARSRLANHVDLLRDRVMTSIELISKSWEADDAIAKHVEQLRSELETVTAPLQTELQKRRSSFRVFLRETLQEKVQTAVSDASLQAQKAISTYLRKFGEFHWATLRAAVRRGGTFLGARHVDIPNEVTLLFEEEITVLWAGRILPQIRKRTRELGADYVQIQAEVLAWAKGQGNRVDYASLEKVHSELRSITNQFGEIGREAVKETKDRVKLELFDALQNAVGRKCRLFVDQQLDVGRGTKVRILDMLRDELPDAVIAVARKAADKVLTANVRAADGEILEALKKIPNPIDSAKVQIVSSHEDSIKHRDVKRRSLFDEKLREVREALPAFAYAN